MFRSYRVRWFGFAALALASMSVACASPVGDDTEESFGAAERAEAGSAAASALAALLQAPERLSRGGEPIAQVEGYRVYAQPAADEEAVSPDAPLHTFVAMKATGEIVYIDTATGGVAAALPRGTELSTLLPSTHAGSFEAIAVRPQAASVSPDEMAAMFKQFVAYVERNGSNARDVVVADTRAVARGEAGAVADDAVNVGRAAAASLRGAATVRSTAMAALRGNPMTLRGLSSATLDKLRGRVQGTVAVGLDEGAALVGSKPNVIWLRGDMAQEQQAAVVSVLTEKGIAPSAVLARNFAGEGSVAAIPGARRVAVTTPSDAGRVAFADDAVVAQGEDSAQWFCASASSRIFVGMREFSAGAQSRVQDTVTTVLQVLQTRLRQGRTDIPTMVLVVPRGGAARAEQMARTAIENARRTGLPRDPAFPLRVVEF